MKRSDLLEKLTSKMEVQNYALDTVKSYRAVANSYFSYLVKHPVLQNKSHKERIESYLTHRVKSDDISPSTQNVEFNALIYLHRHILGVEIEGINALRARPRLRVPPILSKEQVETLINHIPGEYQLIAKLMYGIGLRVNEVLRLRLKDVDLTSRKIVIHAAKGDKERILPIPAVLYSLIKERCEISTDLWEYDSMRGHGVHLPRALEKKYKDHWLSKEWYWLFPNPSITVDPRSKRLQRHHIYDFNVQKIFLHTRKKLGLPVYATPHSLRHAFATHLTEDMLKKGFPREAIETRLIEYMGHINRETLKFYVHLASPPEDVFVLPVSTLSFAKTTH